MQIICIFDSGDFAKHGGLFSIKSEKENLSEFELFFLRMRDQEWLFNFFRRNLLELKIFDASLSIEKAILKTSLEIEQIEESLYQTFNNGCYGEDIGLDQIFRPLHNHEYEIIDLQKTKTKADKKLIRNPWCRLYAIRVERNLFIVTGGGIKLTRRMEELGYLKNELKKIDHARVFLKLHNILSGSDLNDYYENGENFT
jgi:hypothetical protein